MALETGNSTGGPEPEDPLASPEIGDVLSLKDDIKPHPTLLDKINTAGLARAMELIHDNFSIDLSEVNIFPSQLVPETGAGSVLPMPPPAENNVVKDATVVFVSTGSRTHPGHTPGWGDRKSSKDSKKGPNPLLRVTLAAAALVGIYQAANVVTRGGLQQAILDALSRGQDSGLVVPPPTGTVQAADHKTPTASSTPRPLEDPTAIAVPPEVVLPSGVAVEFGESVSDEDRDQIVKNIATSFAFYADNGFGPPGETIIYADSDRETLINRSYQAFYAIAPVSREEFSEGWGPYTGAISFVVDGKGYIFVNTGYPFWNDSPYGVQGAPTRGDCVVPGEIAHLYQQWLSGINFVDYFGTNSRPPSDNGPDWIKFGKEGIMCGYVFNVPESINEAMVLSNLQLVPPDITLKAVAEGQVSGDEVGYIQQAAFYFLLKESPGGKWDGASSFATFSQLLSDPNITPEEAFQQAWGWTIEEFYAKFESSRPTLRLPVLPE